MLARGAKTWIRPSLVKLLDSPKVEALIGMSAESYDNSMLDKLLDSIQQGRSLPGHHRLL